jgi:DNA-binding SARP family transcriptional activator
MRVRILGEVGVEVDGVDVPLPRAKERGLLAVLALRSNQLLSVDQLVEILWGEAPPLSAVKSLRSHVSRLRRSIGNGAVLTVGSAYALNVSDDAVDAHEFVRLIEDSKSLPRDEARSALSTALALWRGRPFTDLADSPRAEAEATRLDELRLGAELDLVDLRLAAGEHDALVGPLELLTSENPGREDFWHRLILALHRSQRRADALRTFQRARTVLREQMGLDPGDDLTRLEQQVIAGASVLDLPEPTPERVHQPPPTPTWGSQSRFVGRRAALDELEAAWERAGSGHGSVVVVRGDPGSGKTALLAELVARRNHEAIVAYGVADHDLHAPFLAVSDVVRSLLEQLPESTGRIGSDETGRILGDVFLGPGGSTSEPGLSDTTSELDSARLLSATEELLDLVGARQPIMILLDDVQWIDRASSAMIRRWARRSDRPLLIVLACRQQALQEPARRLLSDLTITGVLSSIELEGLTIDEVGMLLADQPDLDPHEFAMRTGGNPFLLRQLATHDDPGSLPDGVTAMIGARIRELPEPTREALQTAAVAGGVVDADVLGRVLGVEVDDVITRLDPAVRIGVLDEDPAALGSYLFDHDLIAESLRADLSHNRTTLLHRRFASAISERLEGPLDPMVFALARHLRLGMAPLPDRIRADLAAGRLARRTLAFDDAAEWLESALAMADSYRDIDPCTHRELLLETGRVRGLRGEKGARRALLRAAELSSERDLVEIAIELSRFKHARFTSQADTEVIDVIQRGLDALDEDESPTRALLSAALAAELMWVAAVRSRCDLAEEALGIARERDDPVLLGSVILRTQLSASSPDNLDRRLADGRAAVAGLDRVAPTGDREPSDHLEARIAAGVALATASFEAGDIAAATDLLARARRLCAGAAHTALSWRITSLEIAIAVLQARFDAAEALLARLPEETGEAGAPQSMLVIRGWSQIFLDRGDHEILEAAVGAMARDSPAVPGWGSALGVVLCELNRHEEAAPLLAATMSAPLFEERNLGWLTHRVADTIVARETGDRDAMERLSSLLGPYAGRLCLDIVASAGPVDLALGMLAGGLGDRQAALDHLAAAAELSARSEAPIWQARCELETATVLVATDRAADAPAFAQRAFDRATAAGGRRVARAAEQILRDARR